MCDACHKSVERPSILREEHSTTLWNRYHSSVWQQRSLKSRPSLLRLTFILRNVCTLNTRSLLIRLALTVVTVGNKSSFNHLYLNCLFSFWLFSTLSHNSWYTQYMLIPRSSTQLFLHTSHAQTYELQPSEGFTIVVRSTLASKAVSYVLWFQFICLTSAYI